MLRIHSSPSPFHPHAAGGITSVLRAYRDIGENDFSYVSDLKDADLQVVHAGCTRTFATHCPVVVHNHGLYWTGDDKTLGEEEFVQNRAVINALLHADQITVPSSWVAKSIQRDLRINPTVLPHGIDLDFFQPSTYPHLDYIYWNKNRVSDACNPALLNRFASHIPQQRFTVTVAKGAPLNVTEIGIQDAVDNRGWLQHAQIYLSIAKETFGIGILEALAVATPVLGFNEGNITKLVTHKQTGYLAKPGDVDDLLRGYRFILDHWQTLSDACRATVLPYAWGNVREPLLQVYNAAQGVFTQSRRVTVVIPLFNAAATIVSTLESVCDQSRADVIREVLVVDNNSTDDSVARVKEFARSSLLKVSLLHEPHQGVAHARNAGIARAKDQYIVCLDSDDQIAPAFVESCFSALEADKTLGIAYTSLGIYDPASKRTTLSQWPSEYDADAFAQGKNQVPTCCMFRKKFWTRTGGYRQRYAPLGAGSEDAEFFLRLMSIGAGGRKVDTRPLFRYRAGSGLTSRAGYTETPWRDHLFADREQTPFASQVTPLNHISHPVRQRDQAKVTIVIPCTSNHCVHLFDALDSIERQSYTKWQVIVVFNAIDLSAFHKSSVYESFPEAYPFVTFVTTNVHVGAAKARHYGATLATTPFLLFLDADDWLQPNALRFMFNAWSEHRAIIYSDYVAHDREYDEGRIHVAADFDPQRALRALSDQYIWALMPSLLPKSWYDCIGGFDLTLQSWEDWDLWVRFAKAGCNFYRVPYPLFHYRFHSGELRKVGLENKHALITQMRESKMPSGCSGCGGSRGVKIEGSVPGVLPQQTQARQTTAQREMSMKNQNADELIEVTLHDNNIARHTIIIGGTNYGRRVHGEKFYVARKHAGQPWLLTQNVGNVDDDALGDDLSPVDDLSIVPTKVPEGLEIETADRIPPPKTKNEADLLIAAWPFRADVKASLTRAGILEASDVIRVGEDGLLELDSIGSKTAADIFSYATDLI